MTTHVKQAVELHDLFANNRSRLLDVDWLTAALQPHCKYRFLNWRGSYLRIVQHPREFAQFLILMAQFEVRSYLEIGTSTGGSFMTADSYLRAAVSNYERSRGYDRKFRLRAWDTYHGRFPTCEFQRKRSSRIRLCKERFGAAFIDAQHIEEWVLRDFDKVKNNCQLVGFHDIALARPSTVDLAWAKIKGKHARHWEFVEWDLPPECRCGIGVVQLV